MVLEVAEAQVLSAALLLGRQRLVPVAMDCLHQLLAPLLREQEAVVADHLVVVAALEEAAVAVLE